VLELRDLVCCYGKVTAVKGVSLTVGRGQLVALIGANGAGKTTILKAVSGLLSAAGGTILFDGIDITHASARTILSLGLAHCPEGRHVFPHMTVAENLEMGCYLRTDRVEIATDLARIFDQFPRLAERREQSAGTLSGGEQQMLAIGRVPADCSRRSSSCSTSLRWDSRPTSSSARSTSSPAFGTPARPCSWSNRTPRRRWICVITPICSNRGRWRFRARAAN